MAWLDWLLLALLALAGLAKAVADAQAHGSPRLTRWFPRWAGPDSWRLKYRDGEAAKGPSFWLSTTLLVAFTDLWHFAGLVMWAAADTAFLIAAWEEYRWVAIAAVALRRCVFQPAYSFLRN